MKRFTVAVLTAGLVLSLTACGGDGIEADATNIANKMCDCLKLQEAGKADEFGKCAEEMNKLGKEIEAKYEDLKENKELEEKAKTAMKEALKNCDLKNKAMLQGITQ
ncbi:MAG: hypothetical protein LW884_01920 [Bacteroidetes bacterium]|jgi:hypothetical protein|nr:hypothetical protein [Bacteroidota bacterium]